MTADAQAAPLTDQYLLVETAQFNCARDPHSRLDAATWLRRRDDVDVWLHFSSLRSNHVRRIFRQICAHASENDCVTIRLFGKPIAYDRPENMLADWRIRHKTTI